MTELLRFGAIDVGSNGIRLVLGYVYDGEDGPVFKRETLLRLPIRLGEDVFAPEGDGAIGHTKAHDLLAALCTFQDLLRLFRPVSWMACATSALRDASNQAEILQEIREVAGMELQLLSGSEEAALIFANQVTESLSPQGTYLYIDIGGGSTELSLFSAGQWVEGRSFNIGTVRSLSQTIDPASWRELEDFVSRCRISHPGPWEGIGSGGNLNKIHKLVSKKPDKTLQASDMVKIYQKLSRYSYAERMEKFRLKPDRADVILPAAEIALRILQQAGIETLHIPQLGLADGMVQALYTRHCAAQSPV
ncbi:MAG: Ppx/GppA phosphatase family protein [Candidatus Sericytochromatia bacterium]